MIDTQAIRSKILDLAMRGKLTEQLPEDGTAEELYRQIQAEKHALIKAGKIKKEKPLPEIAANEIPFEIPENWKWIRLNELGTFCGGKTPSMSNQSYWKNGCITWVTSKDMKQKYITASEMMITEEAARELNLLPAQTVLFVVRSGILRRLFPVAILSKEGTINQDLKALKLFVPGMCEFVYCLLKGFEATILFMYTKDGTTVNNIVFDDLLTMPVPLPPPAEQHRIVARIEQAFSALDTIDALQAKYADNLAVLKSKLIDAAIQGKLTEQLPEDGTAEELFWQIQAEKQALINTGKIKKEKPLPEITSDEIPFVIPKSWKWVRLGNICNSIEAGGDKPQDFVKIKDSKHKIPVVANGVSNDGIMGYTATATAPANTITIAGRGTIGFPCYRNYDYCPVVRLIVIMQSALISPLYLFYVFRGLPADSVGSSIPQLTVPMVNPKMIPLPPLAEQKRIVKRLMELLAVCDELKAVSKRMEP